MSFISDSSTNTNWKTCKAEGTVCPQCGHGDRCTVAPDGLAGKCWRNGGEVWHDGPAKATSGNGQARPAGGEKPSYPTAILATEAVEAMTGGRRTKDWTYFDADGNEVAKVVRLTSTDGKLYRPVHRRKSGWVIGDPAKKWPLYRLVELPSAGLVYVVEGEKCADLAATLGLAAVTSAHGSSSAGKTDWSPLAGREIVILPDADAAGNKYADSVCKLLLALDPPARVKVVELPDLPAGGDIEQFVAAGGTADQIQALVDQAEPMNPADHVGGPVMVCLADVEAKPVNWLWEGRIPCGTITLCVGRPGEGKSLITIDAVSRVTTGTPWPDGAPCEKGSAILISYEDDPAQVIRPRLDVHYADCRKVHYVQGVKRPNPETGKLDEVMFTLADVRAMEAMLKRIGDCRIIIIDPVGSAMGGRTDAHRDNEVRAVLAPVARLAEKYGVAVLVVCHTRKSTANHADDLALGSRAFTGIARAVWHVTADPDDKNRRLFLAGKNNLGPPMHGLAFRIVDRAGTGMVAWDRDPVEMSADDALAVENGNGGNETKPGPEAVTRNAATEWLGDLLADGPMASTRVKAEGAAAGYAWRTLHRAKDELRIRPYREQFAGAWMWRLPQKGDSDPTCQVTCQVPKGENNLASWHDSKNQLKNVDSMCQVPLPCQDNLLGTIGEHPAPADDQPDDGQPAPTPPKPGNSAEQEPTEDAKSTCQVPQGKINLASWHLRENQRNVGDSSCQVTEDAKLNYLGTLGDEPAPTDLFPSNGQPDDDPIVPPPEGVLDSYAAAAEWDAFRAGEGEL